MTLDVLNKNENIVNAGYWVPQSVLVAKLVPAKQKNRQSAKTNSRKNFVPHTVYMVRRIGS